MTTTAPGQISRTTARTVSKVSMPLWASTPGHSAATGVNWPNCRGADRTMCRVTSRLPTAVGPMASAAMVPLPKPATSTGRRPTSPGKRDRSSAATHSAARGKNPASRRK